MRQDDAAWEMDSFADGRNRGDAPFLVGDTYAAAANGDGSTGDDILRSISSNRRRSARRRARTPELVNECESSTTVG